MDPLSPQYLPIILGVVALFVIAVVVIYVVTSKRRKKSKRRVEVWGFDTEELQESPDRSKGEKLDFATSARDFDQIVDRYAKGNLHLAYYDPAGESWFSNFFKAHAFLSEQRK